MCGLCKIWFVPGLSSRLLNFLSLQDIDTLLYFVCEKVSSDILPIWSPVKTLLDELFIAVGSDHFLLYGYMSRWKLSDYSSGVVKSTLDDELDPYQQDFSEDYESDYFDHTDFIEDIMRL